MFIFWGVGGGFNYFLGIFTSENSNSDEYFWNRLKPPTSWNFFFYLASVGDDHQEEKFKYIYIYKYKYKKITYGWDDRTPMAL